MFHILRTTVIYHNQCFEYFENWKLSGYILWVNSPWVTVPHSKNQKNWLKPLLNFFFLNLKKKFKTSVLFKSRVGSSWDLKEDAGYQSLELRSTVQSTIIQFLFHIEVDLWVRDFTSFQCTRVVAPHPSPIPRHKLNKTTKSSVGLLLRRLPCYQ
jgi:hypothetical protein